MRPAGIFCQWTQTPVSGFIVRRFKVWNPRVSRQKKVNAFQINFSEFNNKQAGSSFYDKWRWKLSLFSLPHILLFALDAKKYFYYISSALSCVLMFRTYNDCFIFSKSGLKNPKPLQYLLSMNQVNILKFSLKCKILQDILITFDSNSLH